MREYLRRGGAEASLALVTQQAQRLERVNSDKVHTHISIPFAAPIFWIATAICVVAELFILRSAFFPRRVNTGSESIAHSPRGAEMMWAIIPAIGLIFLLTATYRAIHGS